MRIRKWGWFALAAALAMASGCKKTSQPAEGVWADVDGTPITRTEVDKYYRTQLNPDAPGPSQDEALSLRLNILDELINNHILLEKAKKMGLQAADGEVEDKFTEFKSPYTEEEFQRQLKTRGYTVDDLRNDIRQRIAQQPDIYVDGAHNPAGAREIAVFWEQFLAGRNIYLIYGAMRDKAVDEIAGLLFPRASAVILTAPPQTRAISAAHLAEMTGHHARRVEVVPDPAQALTRALELASREDVIFITGSLYLVGELRRRCVHGMASRSNSL